MVDKVLFSSKSDEWETPQQIFEQLDAEFRFNLDACATADNHKCEKYFTKEEDGLSKKWGGYSVWCNPPYSNIKDWAKKCYEEGHKPNTTVVMLIPSRTDTKWWHNYIQYKSEVRFIKGRLKFSNSNPAPFPSAVIIFKGPKE